MATIRRKRGDTYPIGFKLEKEDGSSIDIVGANFKLTVDPQKNPANADNNLFQLLGVHVTYDPAYIEFHPDPEDVDHVGKYYFDVQMIDANGDIRTIETGPFILTQDITK